MSLEFGQSWFGQLNPPISKQKVFSCSRWHKIKKTQKIEINASWNVSTKLRKLCGYVAKVFVCYFFSKLKKSCFPARLKNLDANQFKRKLFIKKKFCILEMQKKCQRFSEAHSRNSGFYRKNSKVWISHFWNYFGILWRNHRFVFRLSSTLNDAFEMTATFCILNSS